MKTTIGHTLLICALICAGCGKTPTTVRKPTAPTNPTKSARASEPTIEADLGAMRRYVKDSLTKHGLSDKLAEGILKYQEADFLIWYQFDREELDKRVGRIFRDA